MLAASERTSQILAAGIPRIGQKANLAVRAMHHALRQSRIRMILDRRVERALILLNQRFSAAVLMPIFPKREEFADSDNKKAKLSDTILMLFTPSSYLTEANASGGRTRFICPLIETKPTNRTSPPHPYYPPNRPSPRQSQIAVSKTPKVLLGRKNPFLLSK